MIAKWKKYYNEKGSGWFDKNISKYAASDVEEGWCEVMSMATHPGGKEYLMGLNDKKLNQFRQTPFSFNQDEKINASA